MGETGTHNPERAVIAVFDIGKTNAKLSAVTADGRILETQMTENRVLDGPPWPHHDTAGLAEWMLVTLAALCKRHDLADFVVSGHGSCGALAGDNPEDGDEPVMPMIDYEAGLPDAIQTAYRTASGSFADRGSAIMLGASHMARQLFYMQSVMPEGVAKARHFLALPQYWAWRMSGVAASELTALGAQSHLYNVVERRFSAIVKAQDWQRLLPPFVPAYDVLGPVRPSLAKRYGLPEDLRIHTGIHDSSANFYRYQASGMNRLSVVSTGTWIVGLSDETKSAAIDEQRGMTINSDIDGHPVAGVLTMTGREFSILAGKTKGTADHAAVMDLAGRMTMALPSLTADNGLFPGSAGRGVSIGEPATSPAEKRALAMLYGGVMTAECLEALGGSGPVVLDGSFLKDPLYPALVSAMSGRNVSANFDNDGVTAGAALLVGHRGRTSPAPLVLQAAGEMQGAEVLRNYFNRWSQLARTHAAGASPAIESKRQDP